MRRGISRLSLGGNAGRRGINTKARGRGNNMASRLVPGTYGFQKRAESAGCRIIGKRLAKGRWRGYSRGLNSGGWS